jgi:hypothetical protein
MRSCMLVLALLVCFQLPAFAQEEVVEKPAKPETEEVEESQPAEKAVEPAELQEQIDSLVKQLGADDWSARDRAMKRLMEIGPAALEAVSAVRNSEDMEVRTRAQEILAKLQWMTPEDEAKVNELFKKYETEVCKEAPDNLQELLKKLTGDDAQARAEAAAALIEAGKPALAALKEMETPEDAGVKTLVAETMDTLDKNLKKFEREVTEEIRGIKFSASYLVRKLAPGTLEADKQQVAAQVLSGVLNLHYWNGPDNLVVRGNKVSVDGDEMDLPAGPWQIQEKGSKVLLNGVEYSLPTKVVRDISPDEALGRVVAMDECSADLKACALEIMAQRKDSGVVGLLMRALNESAKDEKEDSLQLQRLIVETLSKIVADGPSCPPEEEGQAGLEKCVKEWRSWWKTARQTEPYRKNNRER